MKPVSRPLAHAAVDTLGVESQTLKAIEELCELAAALARYRIYGDDVLAVAEELVDARIMLAQVEYMLTTLCAIPTERLDAMQDSKSERLARIIEDARGGE